MTWTFPIPTPGEYQVVLQFAEIYVDASNKRLFHVKIQGELRLYDFDIFDEAGAFAAYSQTFPVTVTTNSLTIAFIKSKQQPKVSGIEILPVQDYSLYINCGSSSYEDSQGNTWVSDSSFVNGGYSYSLSGVEIAGTDEDRLYRSERYGAISYQIEDVPNGSVQVALHFSEIYFDASNKRVFGVKIQGEPALETFDIFSEVGGNTAVVETFTVEVTDGTVTIDFIRITENPKINAIEVHSFGSGRPPSPTPAPTPAPVTPAPTPTGAPLEALYRVNAGAGQFTDGDGNSWEADAHYTSGSPFAKPDVSIGSTDDDELFWSERYDPPSGAPMKYDFAVDNGVYEVALGFAEVYGFTTGQRVFTVRIEDEPVLPRYDIYASVGPNNADIKTFAIEVTDGVLTVAFEHEIENPKVCFIAVFPTSSDNPTAPTAVPVLTPAPTLPSGSSTALYRVNAGGPSFIDSDGKDWAADSFYTGGLTYGNNKASIDVSALRTSDELLYKTERYRDTMSYSFDVANGSYTVVLHFAEIYNGADEPGRRVFDLKLEGATVLNDFDITASVGAYKATTQSFSVNVQDGSLDLSFESEVENAKLNGIEVLSPSQTPAPTPPPSSNAGSAVMYRVNAGGPQFTDSKGAVWLADAGFVTNGSPYGPVTAPISSTVDDELYQTERYASGGPMIFEFSVENGLYEIKLHFAEVYGFTTGERIFNVIVEGEPALTNFDIYATSGSNTADVETVVTEVTDGLLEISFSHVTENPKISAIEVYSISAPGPTTPTLAPVLPPTPAPVQTSPPASTSFEPIYINVGGDAILDESTGITWEADNFYNTGIINGKPSQSISGTDFEELYRTERYDIDEYPNMLYNISLPEGVFEIGLHFADTFSGTHETGARVFDVYVEGSKQIANLDIYELVGPNAALVQTITTTCNDGSLEIEFRHVVENPTLSGISIIAIGSIKPHYAHAVPGGPYFATDTTGSGSALVALDGFYSHTHAAGAELVSFEWKVDDVFVADTLQAEVGIGVGEHIVSLTVVDSTGDIHDDVTNATVNPFGYPFIASLSPDSGEMVGGEMVTISGSSFTASEEDTIVKFGTATLTGPAQINVLDANTIQVLAVPPAAWGTVSVSVTTPVAESNPFDYEYLPLIPLTFKKGTVLAGLFGPTTVAFGPDGNLYVGTQGGDIIKLVLDETYDVISSVVSSAIPDSEPSSPFRSILGIAFDPMDTCPPPDGCKVYVSHSFLFHGDILNYNGKVSAVSGSLLQTVEDVVTNLPVSDHDHGINGLEFDDYGNMYINVGGNTNAGVPGPLSQSYKQEENYLSAATLIARGVTSPSFDGQIAYDGGGKMTSGTDVAVFAAGLRNPFDLVFHSNGKLYATDNGPNLKFGNQSTSCLDDGPEPFHKDKLVLLEEGTYYGHANRWRAEIDDDSRQCTWRDIDETIAGYTGPIRKLESSTNGICEFQTNHFGGALRGQLILGRYKGALYHLKLTNGGEGAGVVDEFPGVLTGDGGLDVTQGPDGALFVASNFGGNVFYQAPDEEQAELLTVMSVFPRRGPEAGGTLLTIYGQKLFTTGVDPTVTVGAQDCVVDSTNTYIDVNGKTSQWVKCLLPSGTGTADVVVSFGEESYTFAPGYRYIGGVPNDGAPSRRLRRRTAK